METSDSEKETRQVLHSLLSPDQHHQYEPQTQHVDQNSHVQYHPGEEPIEQHLDLNELQWHTPVSVSSVTNCDGTVQVFSVNDDLLWHGHTIQVDPMLALQAAPPVPHLVPKTDQVEDGGVFSATSHIQKVREKVKTNSNAAGQGLRATKKKKTVKNRNIIKKKFSPTAKASNGTSKSDKGKFSRASTQVNSKSNHDLLNPTLLEDNASQVCERFLQGCECHDTNCFDGLNPENVFRHRLNIAELTKEEHDMYLMGLTMACLTDREQTSRKKERQRLRANYVYQGRSVCLQAFLYLENCTCYQVKRIRKHVMTHGVVPRIHGNHGKRPHNTFSLDIYCHATEFLKMFIRENGQGKDCQNKNVPILLGADVTRKSIHQSYVEYCRSHAPGAKMMSYSTFRHFMKEQFPLIRFRHVDGPGIPREAGSKQPQQNLSNKVSPSGTTQQCTTQHLKSPQLSHLKIPQFPITHQSDQQQQQQEASTSRAESAQKDQNMEVITVTQVMVNGERDPSVCEIECPVQSESGISSSGNIVVIDSLPVMSANNYITTQTNLRTSTVPSSNIGSKVLTLNSSSLRFVNTNGVNNVNPPALVPISALTMLGPNVFPFVIEDGVSVEVQTETEPEPSHCLELGPTPQLGAKHNQNETQPKISVGEQVCGHRQESRTSPSTPHALQSKLVTLPSFSFETSR